MNQNTQHPTRSESALSSDRANDDTNHDTEAGFYLEDESLFGMTLWQLKRFNFIAGVLLLILAMEWIGYELFTVRPEIAHRLATMSVHTAGK